MSEKTKIAWLSIFSNSLLILLKLLTDDDPDLDDE